jgi:acetyl esterase/lipase
MGLLAVLENTRGRVFVGGHSAGGHYAALLALGPYRGRIAGCLPVSGVFEFGEGSGLPSRPRFLGADPANDAAASPARHVVAEHPPFLLAWGERDFPHLIAQAERFAGLLGDATRLVLPGCDHLGASYDTGRADGAWLPAALAWMAAQA